jgi:hypothetical protein
MLAIVSCPDHVEYRLFIKIWIRIRIRIRKYWVGFGSGSGPAYDILIVFGSFSIQ